MITLRYTVLVINGFKLVSYNYKSLFTKYDCYKVNGA